MSLVVVGGACLSLHRQMKQAIAHRYLEEETFFNVTNFMLEQKDNMALSRHGQNPGKIHRSGRSPGIGNSFTPRSCAANARLSTRDMFHQTSLPCPPPLSLSSPLSMHSSPFLGSLGASEMEGSAQYKEIKGYIDFFFMLESVLGDPQKEATPPRRVAWAAQVTLISFLRSRGSDTSSSVFTSLEMSGSFPCFGGSRRALCVKFDTTFYLCSASVRASEGSRVWRREEDFSLPLLPFHPRPFLTLVIPRCGREGPNHVNAQHAEGIRERGRSD